MRKLTRQDVFNEPVLTSIVEKLKQALATEPLQTLGTLEVPAPEPVAESEPAVISESEPAPVQGLTTHDLVNRGLVVDYGESTEPAPISSYDTHRQHLVVEWCEPGKAPKPRTTHDLAKEALTQAFQFKERIVGPGPCTVPIKSGPGRIFRIEVVEPGVGTFWVFDDPDKADGEDVFTHTGPVIAGQQFGIDRTVKSGITVFSPEGGPLLKVIFE